VYQLSDLGYDAYGFDLFDTVKLRSPEDARFFSALRGGVDPSDVRIADSEIRLPHAAATFDLVFSETVIEHCFALDGMLRECARVLKRDGVSVHTYPSRNSFLEPHLYVPFGGRIQARWWLMLWAVLGVRNLGQPNQTAIANCGAQSTMDGDWSLLSVKSPNSCHRTAAFRKGRIRDARVPFARNVEGFAAALLDRVVGQRQVGPACRDSALDRSASAPLGRDRFILKRIRRA